MRTTDEIVHNGKTLTEILRLHKNWRSGEPDGVRANLNGANLDGANLYRANLDGANLYRANLVDANLDGANLVGANLDGANLYRASLIGAKYKDIVIKHIEIISGLYRYNVVVCVSQDDIEYIGLGCHFRKAADWDGDGFWNNLEEFPDDGSVKTKKRQIALRVAKEFLALYKEKTHNV